jgi:Domain of unknown function (DUF4173)
MNRERAASIIAAASLILGLAADLLLRWIPWGLNVPLWTALFIAAAFLACRAAGRELNIYSVVAAVLAALGIAWRASPVLVTLDILLLVLHLPMLGLAGRAVRVAAAGLSQIGIAILTTAAQAIAGGPQLLIADLQWSRIPRVRMTKNAGVAARGVAIAAPALVLFGTLLTSADAAFANVFRRLFDFSLAATVQHVLVTAFAAGICAGFLRSFALSGPAPTPTRPSFLRLPAAETNIAVALVNALFAAFVLVQFRYFFGGSASMTIGSMTYAEYARRGFFELAWVVALVVPMLLLTEWLVDKESPRGLRLFRALALMQVALVLVIGASAYRRMQLYRDEFGLTQLRLYTTAFMVWIGVVLVWLAVTVLTGKRERFAIGAFATAVLTVVALHAINPDAVIVETNLARAHSGRRAFDSRYAASLSDDAAAVIYANREAFAPHDLARFIERPRPKGWRTWNYSRLRAMSD